MVTIKCFLDCQTFSFNLSWLEKCIRFNQNCKSYGQTKLLLTVRAATDSQSCYRQPKLAAMDSQS